MNKLFNSYYYKRQMKKGIYMSSLMTINLKKKEESKNDYIIIENKEKNFKIIYLKLI